MEYVKAGLFGVLFALCFFGVLLLFVGLVVPPFLHYANLWYQYWN